MTTTAPPPPPVSVPTRELGAANVDGQLWWAGLEATPELQWPASVAVFDRMRRQDSQCKSVMRAITLPIRRTRWRITTGPARPEVAQHVAEDLGLPLDDQPAKPRPRGRGRFSWAEHLQQALLSQVYGHMFFEQQYRIDHPGPGGTHLAKLAPRMPRTLTEIDVALDGGLRGIVQQAAADAVRWPRALVGRPPAGFRRLDLGEVYIPVDRLVGYVNDREGGDWLGHSVLRAAYKNWIIKDRLIRIQAQVIDRNGMGVPWYEAAPGETSLDKGLAIARSVRAGDSAGGAGPAGSKLRLVGVEGALPDPDTAIRYHDEQIARGVLAHFLNLGTQTGSWALGSTFADFFVQSEQAVAELHRDVAQQHVVEDLVDVNWGVDEPAPLLECDEIGSRHDATAQAIKLLRDAGIIIPDRSLEEYVRSAYGLPPKDYRPPVVPSEDEPAPAVGDLAIDQDGGQAA